MKKITLATIVLALALPAAGVFAQQKMNSMDCADMKGMDMKGMDMKCVSKGPAKSKQVSHTAKGVVKKIDAKASRGGSGNLNTAISGNSATTKRARCPGKQKAHEQETAQEPLAALQGQGGRGRALEAIAQRDGDSSAVFHAHTELAQRQEKRH